MTHQSINSSFIRSVKFAWEAMSAMDKSPTELLYDEFRRLRTELEELRQQIEESQERQPQRQAA